MSAGLRQNAALRVRDQLIVAAALGIATYFALLRIAEAKSETAVGGQVAPIDARRREALLDPVAHLYRTPRPDIPRAYQEAHAWIGLAGALRHELAHRDGVLDEAAAYDAELAWYETVRQAAPLPRMGGEERRAWEWGLESAVLSARKARETASGASGAPPP